MKAEIESYIQRSAYVQEVMIPFYASKAGSQLYERTLATLRAECPQYLAELEGLAAGAEMPFTTIMMLNINCPAGSKGDHGIMIYHPDTLLPAVLDKGCTTLMVPDTLGQCRVLGHTEDGPPGVEDKMSLVEVDIPASGGLPGDT